LMNDEAMSKDFFIRLFKHSENTFSVQY